MRWNLRNYQDEAARRECRERGTKLGRWPGDPKDWHHEHKSGQCRWKCLNGKCPCEDKGDCECNCRKRGESEVPNGNVNHTHGRGCPESGAVLGGGVRNGSPGDVDVSGVVEAGIASLLLDVQKDCIALRQENARLRKAVNREAGYSPKRCVCVFSEDDQPLGPECDLHREMREELERLRKVTDGLPH